MGNSKTLPQLLFSFLRPLEQAPIPCLSKYFLAEFLMSKFSPCLCPIATRIHLKTNVSFTANYLTTEIRLLFFSPLFTNLLKRKKKYQTNKQTPLKSLQTVFLFGCTSMKHREATTTDARQDRRHTGCKKYAKELGHFLLFLGLYLPLRFLFHEHYSGYKVPVIEEFNATEKYPPLKLNTANLIPQISLWVSISLILIPK